MPLESKINQRTFKSPFQKATLNILFTSDKLNKRINDVLKEFGITNSQYNILRILAGSHPNSLSPGNIKEVMLFKTSDVTRLIDRLEKKDLVNRFLCPTNRRKMDIGISEKGIELLAQLNPLIKKESEEVLQYNLSKAEADTLNNLLDKINSEL